MPGEYRAIWNVPGGGTGYTVLHFQNTSSAIAQQQADGTRVFFNALAASFPDDIQIEFDSEVLELSLAGVLTAVHPVTPPAQVDGTNTGVYQRAGGARVDWTTGQIVAGRRLTGRTYLVPMASSLFDTEGQITPASITIIQNAANAFISASNSWGNLAIWSRVHQVVHDVIGASVVPRGTILRSRRD